MTIFLEGLEVMSHILGVSRSYESLDLMMSHLMKDCGKIFGCNWICIMSRIQIGVYESFDRIKLNIELVVEILGICYESWQCKCYI